LPPQEPITYFKTIYDLRPTVLIVPLKDCEFNKAKSNIAWIEGVFSGGIALAPDWEEWKRPGCITYSSPDDFMNKLERILSGRIDVARERKAGWDYIRTELNLSRVNRLRVKLIKDMMAP